MMVDIYSELLFESDDLRTMNVRAFDNEHSIVLTVNFPDAANLFDSGKLLLGNWITLTDDYFYRFTEGSQHPP